jgi:hypothetical protein
VSPQKIFHLHLVVVVAVIVVGRAGSPSSCATQNPTTRFAEKKRKEKHQKCTGRAECVATDRHGGQGGCDRGSRTGGAGLGALVSVGGYSGGVGGYSGGGIVGDSRRSRPLRETSAEFCTARRAASLTVSGDTRVMTVVMRARTGRVCGRSHDPGRRRQPVELGWSKKTASGAAPFACTRCGVDDNSRLP